MPDYLSDATASSGPAEVLATGTIISFAGNPVTIEFGRPAERFQVTFRFVDDPINKDETRVQAKTLSPLKLELTLMNIGSPFGEGTEKPAPIGRLPGWDLFLHYRVYAHADLDKTVQFTVYRAPHEGTDA